MKAKSVYLAATLMAATALPASATVINFDDLANDTLVADGYGGVNWGGNWTAYSDQDGEYDAESAPNKIYPQNHANSTSFTFQNDVVFDGVYVSGNAFAGSIEFNLFFGGNLVGTSDGSLIPSVTPTFLSTSYKGLIDTVEVTAGNGSYYVLDNVTYGLSSVPLPASAPMFGAALLALAGFGYGMNRWVAPKNKKVAAAA